MKIPKKAPPWNEAEDAQLMALMLSMPGCNRPQIVKAALAVMPHRTSSGIGSRLRNQPKFKMPKVSEVPRREADVPTKREAVTVAPFPFEIPTNCRADGFPYDRRTVIGSNPVERRETRYEMVKRILIEEMGAAG